MKKVLTIGVILITGLSLVACGNQQSSTSTKSSTTNQTGVMSSNTDNVASDNQKTSCVGSYSNKDIKTAMRIYKDHTARYVYYDPENGNTDDNKITWKYLGLNGTAHDQYELDFHDKNINKPVILTDCDNQIILTSKDKNWNRQTLYRTMSPVNLDKFLENGGKTDDYEYRGLANATSANNGSNDNDPVGDGISEAEAKKKLQEHGVATGNLVGDRNANCWTFRTSDMPLGSYIYTVWDTGEVAGKGLKPKSAVSNSNNSQYRSNSNDSQPYRRTAPSVSSGTPSARMSSSEVPSSEMSSATQSSTVQP